MIADGCIRVDKSSEEMLSLRTGRGSEGKTSQGLVRELVLIKSSMV
jgi:hypothetical protein